MQLIFAIVMSFLAVRGFRYDLTGDGLVLRNTLRFDWLLLFLFLLIILYRSFRDPDRRLKGFSALFAGITAVFYLLGVNLEKTETLARIWESSGYLLNQLNLLYAHMILYYCCTFTAFRFLAGRQGSGSHQKKTVTDFRKVLLFWGILLLLYLPWYLSCYPAITSPDSDDQIRQALGLKPLSNHHPVLLTLAIRLILSVTRLFTPSLQTGVGVCSFLQMITVTFVFAAVYERIRCHLENRLLRLIAFLWYAVYPVHMIFSVTLWKDILFSVCIPVLMLCLDAAEEDEAGFFSSGGKKAILFLSLALLPIFRHNGIAVTIILSIYMLFFFKTFRRQVLVICGGALITVGIWNLAVLPALNARSVESDLILSLLQQQAVRVLSRHREELPEEEISILEGYYNVPDIWMRYDPRIADSVKRHFLNDVFAEDPDGFFSVWKSWGLRYPADYFEAILHNNYGYWFPEVIYPAASFGVWTKEPIEDLQYAPILKTGIIHGILDWFENARYEKTPLMPLLFSRGACWWIWLFCGIFCLYRAPRKFLLFLPGAVLWLSILISPLYCEYRYVYGLFTGLPLIMSSALGSCRKE